MLVSTISQSQRQAAKVAGLAHLMTFALVVYVNFGIYKRLLSGSDAEIAGNILTHERLFRIGVAADLVYCAGAVVLLAALYVILEPVSRSLAILAALWRLVWVLMWIRMTLNLLDALRLLKSADYVSALGEGRTQALAKLYLGAPFDYYYVGLLFGALASTVCGYLWFQSRYIPRGLSAFGVISSAFCVACTIVFFIFPAFDRVVSLSWFDSPMAIFDIGLSFWLLFKGLPRKGLQPSAMLGPDATGKEWARAE